MLGRLNLPLLVNNELTFSINQIFNKISLTLFKGSSETSTSGNAAKTQEDAMEETVKKCTLLLLN